MPDTIQSSSNLIVPLPAIDISFRVATLADLPAIDALQKKHHKQLGFFPRAQMEEYLKNGWVVVAEDRHEGTEARRHEGREDTRSELAPCPSPLAPALLGYCASRDRYLKRDELGVIYQLCVDPGAQRKFIGAALVSAVFERAPYGCKLFCCWCAQDIAANYFWQSMGFVPLAFRAGSAKKSRVHIFWQKRIVEGDEATPYWFPAQTGGGSIREDRLVLPIPPGVRWNDSMPRVLPKHEGTGKPAEGQKRLPAPSRSRAASTAKASQPILLISSGGLRIVNAAQANMIQPESELQKPARKKAARTAAKNDPQMIAATRELRDRWLEKLNRGEYQPQMGGKYHVCQSLISDEPDGNMPHRKFLAA